MINYPDGRKYRRTERSDDQDDVKSKYHAEKVTVDGIRFDSNGQDIVVQRLSAACGLAAEIR